MALGLFGLSIVFLSSSVFAAQKGFWLAIGLLHLTLGAVRGRLRVRAGHISGRRLLPEREDRSLG
ncbi:MAG: hypothetical protein WKF67_02840 [Rubrobacteraceae bacterium]